MAKQEEFEDRFDHDPNDAQDDDWDLDDEDYEAENESYQEYENEETSRSKRIFIRFIKISISLAILGSIGFFFYAPEKIPSEIPALINEKVKEAAPLLDQAKQQVQSVVSKITEKTESEPNFAQPADIVPEKTSSFAQIRPELQQPEIDATEPKAEKTEPQKYHALPSQPANHLQTVRQFNLRGRGQLPDLLTSIKTRPELKTALLETDVYTFEKLPELRPFVRRYILLWTNTTDQQSAEQVLKVPFKTFEDQVIVELLPFTTLKRAGLTPSYDVNMIVETPTDAMSTLFMNLMPIVEKQTTVNGKIAVVEPITTFLYYRCGRDQECLIQRDLLIEMLGLSAHKTQLSP